MRERHKCEADKQILQPYLFSAQDKPFPTTISQLCLARYTRCCSEEVLFERKAEGTNAVVLSASEHSF